MKSIVCFISAFCVTAGSIFAQQVNGNNQKSQPETEPVLQMRTIEFGPGKQLAGLPPTITVGYPMHCSSDGTAFIEFYDKVIQKPGSALVPGSILVPDLYGVARDGSITAIQRSLPQQKREISSISFYPGAALIATLLRALPNKDPDNPQLDDIGQYYIALSKRDGSSSKLIALDLKFEIIRIAVLDSGRFLVTGIDPSNKLPVLGLLDTDGTLLRMLDVDSAPFAASKTLGTIYKGTGGDGDSTRLVTRPFAHAVFVPYGSKVLLLVPGSRLPVRIFGDNGEENSIELKLPKDELPETILPSSKTDAWIVRTQNISTFASQHAGGVVENPVQQILEVDPSTGDTLRSLHLKGLNTMEISCASEKEITALHYEFGAKDSNVQSGWTLLSAQNR